jgi:hypothetical protein
MKKLIIACLATSALVSLSACMTVGEKNTASTPGTVDSGPQSLVPYTGNVITTTDPHPLPTATPNLPDAR